MGVSKVREQGFREISSVKQGQVGVYDETLDGRGYRYALAGASNLARGKLVVAATVDSDATNIAASASASVGARSVSLTVAGAVTAGLYTDGYLSATDAGNEGTSYLVDYNTGTSGAGTVVVTLAEPLVSAVTVTTDEFSLTQNPYHSVVISATDQADMAVGIPNVNITAAYYGWVQTKGVCAALADEAITAGLALTIGTGVAGAVEALDAAGEQQIGVALVAGVDTEYREINLSID